MGDSQIEEIKNRLNILEIVGSYVKLTKTGVNYRGVCPFHSEKGPSFFVSPARQMFKCFGCNKGGDVFEFIKEIEGIEFGDALRILAGKAGVELKRENLQLRSERQRLYEICNLSASFFEKQMEGSKWGKEAKKYLLKRGITEESIKKWRLGYSPDTWQGLSDFLVGKGYTREEIMKAGLAVKSEKGGNCYDRFRGRIIFPIFDLNSQVVGFGARIFSFEGGKDTSKETAKYINTPQTLLYDKSNTLYGLNYAKVPVRKINQCVLTEGYTDAIMAHQAGFENTVSVSGTALTSRQLGILKRYSDNLVLAFDMDMAGDNATKRGINMAEALGFNIKIIETYKGAKDPAEIILENSENWKQSLQKAKSIMDYYFDSAFSNFDKGLPEGKKTIGKMVLPAIKRIQNKIEQSYWTQKLAEKLGVKEEAVLEELKSIKIDEQNAEPDSSGGQKQQAKNFFVQDIGPSGKRKRLLEERIVSLVLQDIENLHLIEDKYLPLFSHTTGIFLEELKNAVLKEEITDKAAFADFSKKEEHKIFFDNFALKDQLEEVEDSSKELNLCLFQLKDVESRNHLNAIQESIKKEENPEKKEELIREFEKKAKELHYPQGA